MTLLQPRDTRRYDVPLAGTGVLDGNEAIDRVISRLLEDARVEPDLHALRVGTRVTNRAGIEQSLFLETDWRTGALVRVWYEHMSTKVVVFVSRTSRLVRWCVWASLLAGLPAGLALANHLLPSSKDKLVLAVGLLAGLVPMLVAIVVVPRMPGFIDARAHDLVERLDGLVTRVLKGTADGNDPRLPNPLPQAGRTPNTGLAT